MSYLPNPRRRTTPAMDYDMLPIPRSKPEASDFLQTLLNKNLRVTTTDSRMFLGNFKCTDSESNIVLQHVYEYRPPTQQQVAAAAAAAGAAGAASASSSQTTTTKTSSSSSPPPSSSNDTLKLDMTSRYLGLIVVPGKQIVKVEVEEFASQLRGARERRRREREAREKEEDEEEERKEREREREQEKKKTRELLLASESEDLSSSSSVPTVMAPS